MSVRRTIGHLTGRLVRRTFATMRVTIVFPDGRAIGTGDYTYGTEIFALTERDLLGLAGMTAYQRFTTLIARGRDGDIATAAATRLGCTVVRGATARGGASALRTLLRTLAATSHPAALVVDGPLGPAGHARPGAVRCASTARRELRAVAIVTSPAIRIPGTWSGLSVPLPFSRAVIAVDDPLQIAAAASREDVVVATRRLSERLEAMRTLAETTLAERRRHDRRERRFA
jgi:lysophospholipid acyltransferase (LPLAT)-like uncharacterized protein